MHEKFFWISQGKVIHVTGEVDKSVKFSCQFFSGFNTPKIVKIAKVLIELWKQ